MIAHGTRIEPHGLILTERVVDIWRCAKVVKGGRRFSFAAMAVVGNGEGVVGIGYGKAREVPAAIEKAAKNARKNLLRVPTYGSTLPHEVIGKFGSARVIMLPARPGTGLIAGAAVRQVLECVGIHDLLTKSIGKTTNPKNLVKAALQALLELRSRETVGRLRGVEPQADPMIQSIQKVQATRDRAKAQRASLQRAMEEERAKAEAAAPKPEPKPAKAEPVAEAKPEAEKPAEGGAEEKKE